MLAIPNLIGTYLLLGKVKTTLKNYKIESAQN
jgi:Na+/alanine symporter